MKTFTVRQFNTNVNRALSCIKTKGGKKKQYKGKEYKNLFNAVKASRQFVHDVIFNN